MYCEKCKVLFEEGARCPECRSRRVREPREGDPCFLIAVDFIWCDLLADVLTQEGIPFLKKGLLGAGMTARLGGMLEEYRFFVPFECIPRARELTEGLFGGEAELIEEEENGEAAAQEENGGAGSVQEEILSELARLGLPREDIYAVMIMLSREDKARAYLEAIRPLRSADPDELRRICGEIAFGKENGGE